MHGRDNRLGPLTEISSPLPVLQLPGSGCPFVSARVIAAPCALCIRWKVLRSFTIFFIHPLCGTVPTQNLPFGNSILLAKTFSAPCIFYCLFPIIPDQSLPHTFSSCVYLTQKSGCTVGGGGGGGGMEMRLASRVSKLWMVVGEGIHSTENDLLLYKFFWNIHFIFVHSDG